MTRSALALGNALFIAVLLLPSPLFGQCCAGGSGSCIAGGAAQGVLEHGQMELNTNYQFIRSDKFYKGDQLVDERTFDSYQSQYQYFKLAYGVSRELTASLELGYYMEKLEVGLHNDPATTYSSKGLGDLLFFPRYSVYRKETAKSTNEVTLGLGYKVPLGSFNDSVGNLEPFSGETYYVTKPTNVQLSSGAQDLFLYGFLHHGFVRSGVKLFANAMYIMKGWNPNGEKLGDFCSLAVYASRTFFEHFNVTLQTRYETMGRMQIHQSVLLFGKPSNYFPEATGYNKWFFTPQVGFTKGKFTLYATTDIPLYQRMNTSPYYTQVGSQQATTVGLSYRFIAARRIQVPPLGPGSYVCPMHPEEVSDGPSRCSQCGMDLEPVE